MIVGRSMHERWLSNAYVVGDAPGGTAVFVDSGAPLGPLLELVERENLTPTHLLRTHTHPDHVEHEDDLCGRFDIPVVTGEVCFTGDVLFKDAVGGGPADVCRASVMQLMELAPPMRVLPGHTDET